MIAQPCFTSNESRRERVQGREWIELEACERNVSYLFKSKVATWQFLSHHFCGSCVVEMFAVCQCHNYCLRCCVQWRKECANCQQSDIFSSCCEKTAFLIVTDFSKTLLKMNSNSRRYQIRVYLQSCSVSSFRQLQLCVTLQSFDLQTENIIKVGAKYRSYARSAHTMHFFMPSPGQLRKTSSTV